MNRGQIATRVLSKCRRTDSTSQTQVDDFINEIVKHCEQEVEFFYTKKSQEDEIPASTKSFTLPSNLILHQPFSLLLVDDDVASDPTYKYLIKTKDTVKDIHFPNPLTSGTKATYWTLTGKDNGLGFDVYPVMDAAETLRISGGHFYTSAFTDDADSNWLTNNIPWLIIEGASALCFDEYGETEKADRSRQLFLELLQKAKMEQDKMEETGRMKKAKMLSDLPVDTASKLKTYGY